MNKIRTKNKIRLIKTQCSNSSKNIYLEIPFKKFPSKKVNQLLIAKFLQIINTKVLLLKNKSSSKKISQKQKTSSKTISFKLQSLIKP